MVYTWKLNGVAQSGTGPDFSFTPDSAGDFTVEVVITDSTNSSRSVTAGPTRLGVHEYVKPQITSVAATPNSITCSSNTAGIHTASLIGQATGSACGGSLAYKWTVTEGSVASDTSANATFDASSLNFEGGGQAQSKTITAALTVTDETGQSASQQTAVTVGCPPQFKRLSDLVFANNKARVSNCGKRILIDQAAPQAGTAYDVVLAGHRAADEDANAAGGTRRGRRTAAYPVLDEQRVLNAAAVLTASAPDPGLCGTSNGVAAKERTGSRVSEADKDRRVEVYLVPKNTQVMPPAAKNARVPERDVKALGCPK